MENPGSKLQTWIKLALLVAALGVPAVVSAQIVFYGFDYNTDSISTINPLTQTATLVGPTGLGAVSLQGLAISPGGALYATSTAGDLYSVSTTTGTATLIGSTGRGDIEGLDFMGSTLVGITSGSNPTLFSINTGTAATTDIVTNLSPAFSGAYSATAMAVVDNNTVLISTFSSGSQANLYSANVSTGAVTFIGLMNVSVGQFASMDIGYDGVLYGFTNDGTVYQINQSNASVNLLGTIPGFPFWLDVTTQAIPEPSTYALLLSGTGLLWLMRRRSRRAA